MNSRNQQASYGAMLPALAEVPRFLVPRVRVVVAIPARNEAEHLTACLEAMAWQRSMRGTTHKEGAFGVLLLLNNCSDGSALVAAKLRPHLPFPLLINEVTLPKNLSNAGYARRLAMDAAATWLSSSESDEGHLLTTDADSRVAFDWVARHQKLFDGGIDAVAGLVRDDARELHHLPLELRRRARLEARYAKLLAKLETLLDPRPWDPWPRHSMASGASLGVSLSWYRRIGGLPIRPIGEDRALIACLDAAGARIRHCRKVIVTTSCRLCGRAEGGMADTMRRRIESPDSVCDESLPPVWRAIRRFLSRAASRRILTSGIAAAAADYPRLRPSELQREIRRAEAILLALKLDPGPAVGSLAMRPVSGRRHQADIPASASIASDGAPAGRPL